MKKILITGADSYIGTSFEQWMKQERFVEEYQVDTLDMRIPQWKEYDFSKYEVVFHVAGIAHSDIRAVSEETKQLYYAVNKDLAVETAKVAKQSGVKQFIYMSSIIVFGDSVKKGSNCVITKNTQPKPANFYGDSKLQADIQLQKLDDDNMRVVILRPPMIYGKGSRGNYPRLSKLAKQIPFFPNVKNQRSMLHIDNLCEFIRLMIVNEEAGIFYPQNKEYVCTAQMVKEIREFTGKKMLLLSILNPFVWMMSKCFGVVNKVFGTMVYEKDMSNYDDFSYCINDLTESIRKTEE